MPPKRKQPDVKPRPFKPRAPTQHVLVAKGAGDPADDVMLRLPHPRTGQPAQFLLSGGQQLCEVQAVRPERGSWFAGDEVVSNGTLLLATPVDPRFLLLPVLEAHADRSGNKFGEWQQMLTEAGNPLTVQLRSVPGAVPDVLCDAKRLDESLVLVRLNQDRVVRWLVSKVRALSAALPAFPHVVQTSKATVETLRRSDDAADQVSPLEANETALGFLAEYVSDAWIQRVRVALNMPAAAAAPAAAPAAKPAATSADDGGEIMDYQALQAKLSAKSKATRDKEIAAPKKLGQTKRQASLAAMFGRK